MSNNANHQEPIRRMLKRQKMSGTEIQIMNSLRKPEIFKFTNLLRFIDFFT